jgi:hypothetical protein
MLATYLIGAIFILILAIILFHNDINWSPKDIFILGYIVVFWPAVFCLLFGYFFTAYFFDE